MQQGLLYYGIVWMSTITTTLEPVLEEVVSLLMLKLLTLFQRTASRHLLSHHMTTVGHAPPSRHGNPRHTPHMGDIVVDIASFLLFLPVSAARPGSGDETKSKIY